MTDVYALTQQVLAYVSEPELNHALDVSPENTRAIPSAQSLALDLSRSRMPSQAAQIDATLERMGLSGS